MMAEFSGDGTAKITMFGQTLQGKYKLDGGELVWTLNGRTTDDENRTIKYKRM